MSQVTLQLLSYEVNKIEFNLIQDYIFDKTKKIELNQNLDKNIEKIDENKFKVSLNFEIFNLEEKPTPFTLSIKISGVFHLSNWENKENITLATVNTIAILFPFVRSLVATVTANTSVPPYILPVFNVAAWLEQNEKK